MICERIRDARLEKKMTLMEVAAALGIPEGTAKSRMRSRTARRPSGRRSPGLRQ